MYLFNCPKSSLPFLPRVTPVSGQVWWEPGRRWWGCFAIQQLECHRSPEKNSGFNLYWSQNTRPCKSRNSGSSGAAGALPSTVNNNSNTPRVTSCFNKWLTVALPQWEGEGSWEIQGNPSQPLCFFSFQKWGHRGKKIRMWLFKSERKEHPITSCSSSESFHFFCCAQAQLLAAGFCFLVKKQDLPLSKARGQNSGSLVLAGPSPENTPVLQPAWGSREISSALAFSVEQPLK